MCVSFAHFIGDKPSETESEAATIQASHKQKDTVAKTETVTNDQNPEETHANKPVTENDPEERKSALCRSDGERAGEEVAVRPKTKTAPANTKAFGKKFTSY